MRAIRMVHRPEQIYVLSERTTKHRGMTGQEVVVVEGIGVRGRAH